MKNKQKVFILIALENWRQNRSDTGPSAFINRETSITKVIK